MNLTLSELCLLLLLFGIALLTWQHFKIREYAYLKVKAECTKLNLDLLDESIYGIGWKLTFQRGQFHVIRRYQFFFSSSGEDRYQGEIVFTGNQQTKIHFDPHRI